MVVPIDDISAPGDMPFLAVDRPSVVESIALITEGNSDPGDDVDNQWTWLLSNHTQGSELIAATVGTFSFDGGVGGGPITARTRYALFPDQNAQLSAGDVLVFGWNEIGVPGPITGARLQVTFADR